jgi:hypothetical protein
LTERRADSRIDYKIYPGYFESNKSGLKGEASHLVFTDRKKFAEVLRLTPPLAGKPKHTPVGDEAFTNGVGVVVIKRSDRLFTYKVEKITLQEGKLTLDNSAEGKRRGTTARFASPLVVRVVGKGVNQVEFIENGKSVAKVKVEK